MTPFPVRTSCSVTVVTALLQCSEHVLQSHLGSECEPGVFGTKASLATAAIHDVSGLGGRKEMDAASRKREQVSGLDRIEWQERNLQDCKCTKVIPNNDNSEKVKPVQNTTRVSVSR